MKESSFPQPSNIVSSVFNFKEIEYSSVSKGDIIYITNKEHSIPFIVLDCAPPYFYLENTKSGFAAMYHATKPIYKLL